VHVYCTVKYDVCSHIFGRCVANVRNFAVVTLYTKYTKSPCLDVVILLLSENAKLPIPHVVTSAVVSIKQTYM